MLPRRSLVVYLLGFVACAADAAACLAQNPTQEKNNVRVYIGTTGAKGGGKGIYRLDLDRAAGKLSPAVLAVETTNPHFVAVHPNGKFVYAVSQSPEAKGGPGTVTALAVDSTTGDLTKLNEQSSGGTGPAFVMVDRAGKNVLIANYGGGSCGVLPIEADGKLKPLSSFVQHTGASKVDPQRQEAPHAHSIYLDAANRFAFVPDLGMDKVMIYRFDGAKGTLTPNNPAFGAVPPGGGPRHFAFHPDGRHAYAINEMGNTVTAFNYNPEAGSLDAVQTIGTLPDGADPVALKNTTAEVVVHPSGKFLYGSNRGHNSIAIFTIDPSTAKLTAAGHQGHEIKMPRNFNIDPSGEFLLVANLDGNNVSLFRVDEKTGQLTPTGSVSEVPKPMCLRFWPAM